MWKPEVEEEESFKRSPAHHASRCPEIHRFISAEARCGLDAVLEASAGSGLVVHPLPGSPFHKM